MIGLSRLRFEAGAADSAWQTLTDGAELYRKLHADRAIGSDVLSSVLGNHNFVSFGLAFSR